MSKRRGKSSIIREIDKKSILTIMDSSFSYGEMLDKIGVKRNSGNYKTLQSRLEEDGFDLTEIKEKSNKANSENVNRFNRKTPLNEILVENSTYNRGALKIRLVKENLVEYVCNSCGLGNEWNGNPIVLQLEHKNGINNDNRIENLCFLCPNCHSQTSTFSGRNANK